MPSRVDLLPCLLRAEARVVARSRTSLYIRPRMSSVGVQGRPGRHHEQTPVKVIGRRRSLDKKKQHVIAIDVAMEISHRKHNAPTKRT